MFTWKDQLGPCQVCKGKGEVYSRRFLEYASRTCPKCRGAKQVVVQTATWKYILATILAIAGLVFLIYFASISFGTPTLSPIEQPTGVLDTQTAAYHVGPKVPASLAPSALPDGPPDMPDWFEKFLYTMGQTVQWVDE